MDATHAVMCPPKGGQSPQYSITRPNVNRATVLEDGQQYIFSQTCLLIKMTWETEKVLVKYRIQDLPRLTDLNAQGIRLGIPLLNNGCQ